jgi:hypothetical protein
MSNNYTPEEKLEILHKGMKKNTIFFCIGWFVFAVSFVGLNYIDRTESWPMFLALLGWVIIGGSRIWMLLLFGLGAAFKADYEVITTDGYGNKSSDGGAESMLMNLFIKGGFMAVLAFIGAFITIIHLFIQTIKYFVINAKVTNKPAFKESCLYLIVMNIAVFFGSVVVGAVIQKIVI